MDKKKIKRIITRENKMIRRNKMFRLIGFIFVLIFVIMLAFLGYKLSYKKDVERIDSSTSSSGQLGR